MMLRCPPQRVPPGTRGVAQPFPQDFWCISPNENVSQTGRARAIAWGSASGSPSPPATPGAPWNSPATPLASVSSEFPSPEARSPHGVGRGRYPGTTRRSQDPTGIERRRRARGASSSPASAGPRGPVPAPTPAAPELRLMRFSQPGGSFSSSAIFPPAAEPAPPPPHRLCASAHRCCRLAEPAPHGVLATALIGHFNCPDWLSGFLLSRSRGGRSLTPLIWASPQVGHTQVPPSSFLRPLNGGKGTQTRPLLSFQKSRPLLCVLRHRAHPIGYYCSNSRLPKP